MRALLTLVSALDQRKISDDVVESWSRILGGVNPVFARVAVEEHFATKPDVYLSVGHVVAGAKRVAEREGSSSDSESRRLEESSWRSDPIPVCRDHGLAIVRCDDCCAVLASQVSHLSGDRLHEWAVANIYVEGAGRSPASV